MSTLEVARIIGEVLGALSFMIAGSAYVVRQIWRLLDSVAELRTATAVLTQSTENMTARVREHSQLDESRYLEISNRLSNIEGRLGIPSLTGDAKT